HQGDRMKPARKKAAATLPLVRCAIYTRKSTEEGLEQEFNSLDAQRESAEAFIRSQTHEGWTCLSDRYDDGGFTGGNMERPALQRLLTDIRAGKVDCVVSYKVDRLSRSLLDFAKMKDFGGGAMRVQPGEVLPHPAEHVLGREVTLRRDLVGHRPLCRPARGRPVGVGRLVECGVNRVPPEAHRFLHVVQEGPRAERQL